MSIQQIARVLYLPERITDGQFRILVYLADLANENGENVYPSVRWLAKQTGYHERTIRSALATFQARGWLHRVDRSNGYRRIAYRLTLPCGKVRGKTVDNLWRSTGGVSAASTQAAVQDQRHHDPAVHDLSVSASSPGGSAHDPSLNSYLDPDVRKEQERRAAPPSSFHSPQEINELRVGKGGPSRSITEFIRRLNAVAPRERRP